MIASYNSIKEEALEKLSGIWGTAALATLIVGVITAISTLIPFSSLLVGAPFALGLAMFFLKVSRNQQVEVVNIFDGFKNFGNAIGLYLLMAIIVAIGLIFLIIPGIIIGIALSQSYRILIDEPKLGIIDSMKKRCVYILANVHA